MKTTNKLIVTAILLLLAVLSPIMAYGMKESNPDALAVRVVAAFDQYGETTFVAKDTQGNEHNWRQELIDELAKRVDENGSWHNDAPRWHENNPILVTTYAVLALQEATKK